MAAAKLKAAKEEADSEINIAYAEAAHKTAEADRLQDEDANKKVESAVPQAVYRSHLLKAAR